MNATLATRLALPSIAPSPRSRVLLAMLAATSLWGASFIALKAVLAGVPPITVAFARFSIALLVLRQTWPLPVAPAEPPGTRPHDRTTSPFSSVPGGVR